MNKKNSYNTSLHIFLIVLSIIIFIMLTLNIVFIYQNLNDKRPLEEAVYIKDIEGTYDSDKNYYTTIKFDKFKKIYKSNQVSTIAIIDNSSKSYNKFIELINKTAFYKNTKIYLLETSKLSRKNEISFYNLDDRFKKLESNYIITVSNNKVVSITTIEESEINTLIKGLGE